MHPTDALTAIALIAGTAALIALWVTAIISIIRTPLLTPLMKALWVLAVAAFTVVGPVVWFATKAFQTRHPFSTAASLSA